jgi:hypothetical protein
MDPDLLAPVIILVTVTLSTAGVLIFRPLAKRLGDLIEITGRRQSGEPRSEDIARLTNVVSSLADRLDHLEQRQDFADRILISMDRPAGESQARLREPEAKER